MSPNATSSSGADIATTSTTSGDLESNGGEHQFQLSTNANAAERVKTIEEEKALNRRNMITALAAATVGSTIEWYGEYSFLA